jgi:phage baseplate assembly protein gpV
MNPLYGLYFGTITKVFPVGHPKNTTKYQTMYSMVITVDLYCSLPVTAVKMDSNGGYDNFEDEQLRPNDQVYVMFPKGDRSMGVIMGGIRSYHEAQDPAQGYYYNKRFNGIETEIDSLGNWSVTADQGPNAQVTTSKVILDDSEGEKITLDMDTKTMTIDAGTWNVNVTASANINIAKDVSITVGGDANITVTGAANVKAKTLDADIGGSAKIKCKSLNAEASGSAKIKAATISLNGQMGQVLTTMTSPIVDFITGIPTQGVPTVSAGGG